MFGGTYQCASRGENASKKFLLYKYSHWVDFREEEKEKKRHPMCANHFHSHETEVPNFSCCPLSLPLSESGLKSTSRYHKSPVPVATLG